MSQASITADIPSRWDDVDEWASAAVRGANNWLITLRNATDEGIDPWSDEFTDGQNGLMTYSEGLTVLALVEQSVPGIEDRPEWQKLRRRYYRNDFAEIIDRINAADGPKFVPDPYLPGIDTNHFTVAATFSTSAIIETLVAGVDLGNDVSDDELEAALTTNIEWLLANRVEDVDTEGAAGWAWVGTESSRYDESLVTPMNYFTYSASIVLCDLVNNRDIDIIDAAVSEYEDEIFAAIEEANNFLFEEYWSGGTWSKPTGLGEEVTDRDRLLSTCYAFVGLSYIEYVVDGIEMSDEQRERMGAAMGWALNYNQEREDVWATTISYDCDGVDFVDGSAPYVLLDAILELINFREDIVEYIDDFGRAEAESIARDELAPTILNYCWAGDEDFEEKGFRHVDNGQSLLSSEDGDPENNMTAIYSTGTAVETFLLNFLESGDRLTLPERSDREPVSGEADRQVDGDSEDRPVDNRTINNIIYDGDTDGGSYPDEVSEMLEGIRTEFEQLSGDIREAAGTDDDAAQEYETRNLSFLPDLLEFQGTLTEEYERNWPEVTDNLGGAKQPIASSLQSGWEAEFREYNTERFLQFLAEVYFCPDRETFEEEVMIDEDILILLLPRQREIVDTVAEWDDGQFTDADARKTYVEETVEELIENPWGGDPVNEVAMDFSKRFQDENS